jgi:ATP-dependent exoDNAse (exonuclease V) beta subunit
VLPDPLLQDDQAARLRALDITRSFVVQAPAGSGKTELLIQRYLALLATVDAPEEILAITFTVKAANEMQQRVTAALHQAARNEAPPAGHHRITFDAASKVLERDRQLGWQLTESPRRMRIQTLDAFNASIARSLPFSSGLGGAVHVASDEDMQAIYRAAAAATLDWLLSDDAVNAAIEQLLVHLDNNTAAYIEHVARMLATRDQWLPIIGTGRDLEGHDGRVRATLERNIGRRITAHLENLQRLLPPGVEEALLRLGRYAAGNLRRPQSDGRPPSVLHTIERLSPASAGHLAAWRELADLLLTRAGDWRRTVNAGNGFPTSDRGEKQEMLALLATLGSHSELRRQLHKVRSLPDPGYTDAQWSVLRALFRLLPLAVTELRRLFSEQGSTDYTEVALAAGAALGDIDQPGDIALLLDYRLRHLLIDEMQDTSIAQYHLVETLVAGWQPGDGRTLFCVGDPMQSIYRFRDAEVGRFLLARDHGIGGVTLESLLLRRNFRSGEELVRWFNSVFKRAFPAGDDIAAGAISYAASVPAALHGAAGVCRIHPLFGATPEEEAAHTVGIVRECLQAPAEQNTALLVRSRTRLPELLSQLRAAGIDYQAVEIDRMTDLPEIIDLLALTRALCHRGDRIAWLGLLRSPWVGLTWRDVHRLVMNDPRSSVWELLHDAQRLAGLSPEGAARVRTFIQGIAPFTMGHGAAALRETVERAWFALGGPLARENAEQVENVYRFLDVVERMEVAGTLPDVAELEATLDQERVSSRSDHDGRLQIMTIHKAKGLQFDHVVLYGLGRRPRGDRQSVMSWLHLPDASGREELLLSPIGAHADLEADRLHRYIAATDREKERLEHVRLLYVACTRARRSLHLTGHVPVSTERDEFGEPPVDSLLHGIWPAVQPIYRDAFNARGGAPDRRRPSRGRILREPALRRLPGPVKLPPAPPLPGIVHPPPAEPEVQVHYDWVGPVARHAGTIVHRWLKRMTGGDLDATATDAALLPLSRTWARELGVPAAEVEAVCARVERSLARIREDERGRWLLAGAGHSELPLTGLWNGRLESIVIDRVRIDDDGVHWIVDYKTSTHEGADLAGFLQQETERYRLQLRKYAELYRQLVGAPVRTALYFPLLQEFREVLTNP